MRLRTASENIWICSKTVPEAKTTRGKIAGFYIQEKETSTRKCDHLVGVCIPIVIV